MARTTWITQAAAIPYRVVGAGQGEVLLVTSSRSGCWTLPKGGIKHGASAGETAGAETLEEAGAAGCVEAMIGEFTFEKEGELLRARVHPLRVTTLLDRWAEEDRRLRAWVPIAEVARFVQRKALLELLVAFRHRFVAATASGRRARVA